MTSGRRSWIPAESDAKKRAQALFRGGTCERVTAWECAGSTEAYIQHNIIRLKYHTYVAQCLHHVVWHLGRLKV